MPAYLQLGQPDFFSGAGNQGLANPTRATLCTPDGMTTYNGMLFVSDYSNSRELFYEQMPWYNGALPDYQWGQPDWITGTTGNGTSGLNTVRMGGTAGKEFFLGDN